MNSEYTKLNKKARTCMYIKSIIWFAVFAAAMGGTLAGLHNIWPGFLNYIGHGRGGSGSIFYLHNTSLQDRRTSHGRKHSGGCNGSLYKGCNLDSVQKNSEPEFFTGTFRPQIRLCCRCGEYSCGISGSGTFSSGSG